LDPITCLLGVSRPKTGEQFTQAAPTAFEANGPSVVTTQPGRLPKRGVTIATLWTTK